MNRARPVSGGRPRCRRARRWVSCSRGTFDLHGSADAARGDPSAHRSLAFRMPVIAKRVVCGALCFGTGSVRERQNPGRDLRRGSCARGSSRQVRGDEILVLSAFAAEQTVGGRRIVSFFRMSLHSLRSFECVALPVSCERRNVALEYRAALDEASPGRADASTSQPE